MKMMLFLLGLLSVQAAFAQTFQQRVEKVHPSKSIKFDNPKYLGLPLLGRTAQEVKDGDETALWSRGEEYCQFLKYKGLLSISEQASNNVTAYKLESNYLVEYSFSYMTSPAPGGEVYMNPTYVKSLRCKTKL